MANITLDFLHNYHTGERRESDPAYAYQYDEGHVLEAVLPSVVTTVELHYWIRGMEEAEAYTPTSITPNDENSCTVLGNIPNKYFETNGELRIYIVVNDASASITTYEGKLNICQRSKPDDYVDDDPENEATRVLIEAQEAAATATAAAQTAQDVADSIPSDYTQLSNDVSSLKEDYDDIDDRVTALEGGGSGSGLTAEIKVALLQIASKVAYIDDDGQDYYDDLYDALYPSAEVVSISAVYTQSGTVYDTDTLESLRADLVVTANMSDHTTRTVTTYTLSGTLAFGTSTITVTYGGKTDTFNVTVASVLYPLTNGEHTFTDSATADRTVTVTNQNHVKYVNPHATTASNINGSYAIFDVVTANTTNANTQNINSPSATLFTLPSGASVEMEISNIQCSALSDAASTLTKYAIALRSGSTSVVTTGDLTPTDTSKTVTKTMDSASNITCVFFFAGKAIESLEFDISLTVNGERWI